MMASIASSLCSSVPHCQAGASLSGSSQPGSVLLGLRYHRLTRSSGTEDRNLERLTHGCSCRPRGLLPGPLKALAAEGGRNEEDEEEEPSSSNNNGNVDKFRAQLEGMVGREAASFEGRDLAKLIQDKYGRSYDVQLIKKDFLGRPIIAMNVMWKYREQRSFPLSEEQYLSRLDYVALLLREWGAVMHVTDTLNKTSERPRVGKAVSIMIDVGNLGERKEEWYIR